MKKIITSFVMALALVSTLNASQKSGCVLAQKGAVEVSWKAYKTPLKLGVGGVFDDVKYTAIKKEGKNFREILVGSTVAIDTKKVNSKNKGRDEKLYTSFFKQMNVQGIKAKIIDIKADPKVKGAPRTGVVAVEIDLNGINKVIPMKYTFSDSMFSANGVIDVFDFSAHKALTSINRACHDLHKGKTWSDVNIGFTTKIEAILCNVKPLK